MKLQEKFNAIRLRKQGKSYREIKKRVGVSKGTLSLWLRDIELTHRQLAVLLRGREKSRYAGAKANQSKRVERTKEITNAAKEEAKYAYHTHPLFLAGLMLYWAEGDKSQTREVVKFSNSDPEMVKLMMKWFRTVCRVPEERFRICIHMHALHCRPEIEKYWSQIASVPLNQFHRTQVKPTSLRYRRNPLYNGTCAVSVQNRNLFRRISGWKAGVIEAMSNFPKPIIKAPVAQRIEHWTSNPVM